MQAVTVGAGSSQYYDRVCVHIERTSRKLLKLYALQAPASERGRRIVEDRAELIRVALGMDLA